MPKGVNLDPNQRLMIWRSMFTMSAEEVFRIHFHSDSHLISLKTLKKLEIMFHNPNRVEETVQYLYNVKRGVRASSHDIFDGSVEFVLKYNPLQNVEMIRLLLSPYMVNVQSSLRQW